MNKHTKQNTKNNRGILRELYMIKEEEKKLHTDNALTAFSFQQKSKIFECGT